MPRKNNQRITEPRFVIAAYKGDCFIGYLFWQNRKRKPKTLKLSHPTTAHIATFSSYENAELAFNEAIAAS